MEPNSLDAHRAFCSKLTGVVPPGGNAAYFTRDGEFTVYQTWTAENGLCADIHQGFRLDLVAELQSREELDAIDIVVPQGDAPRQQGLLEHGFTRQPIALVYMPLQSREFFVSLRRTAPLPEGSSLRWATAADMTILITQLDELLRFASRPPVHRRSVEEILLSRLEQPWWSGGLLILEDHTGFMATLNLYLDGDGGAQIFDLIVDKRCRNQGLGGAIYGAIGRSLQDSGFEMLSGEVDTGNKPALSFWVRAFGGLVDNEHCAFIWQRSRALQNDNKTM